MAIPTRFLGFSADFNGIIAHFVCSHKEKFPEAVEGAPWFEFCTDKGEKRALLFTESFCHPQVALPKLSAKRVAYRIYPEAISIKNAPLCGARMEKSSRNEIRYDSSR